MEGDARPQGQAGWPPFASPAAGRIASRAAMRASLRRLSLAVSVFSSGIQPVRKLKTLVGWGWGEPLH